MDKEVVIPFSKTQLWLELAAVICFMVVGLWLLLDPPVIDNKHLGTTASISITGLLTVFYFGMLLLVLVQRMRNKKPALVITQDGILDNASSSAAGMILWQDIRDIRIRTIMGRNLIKIIVANPGKYISDTPGVFRRKSMQINQRLHGSPITIPLRKLKANPKKLYRLLTEKWQEHLSHHPGSHTPGV